MGREFMVSLVTQNSLYVCTGVHNAELLVFTVGLCLYTSKSSYALSTCAFSSSKGLIGMIPHSSIILVSVSNHMIYMYIYGWIVGDYIIYVSRQCRNGAGLC